MQTPLVVDASPAHAAAIRAISELLNTLKLQSAFVGDVALAAWLGKPVGSGSVDVLAVLTPERMRQVPMMASHRGFSVNSAEIERSEELDLIPLRYDNVRIHVLMATNALYGKMVQGSVEAQIDDATLRIVGAEDLALLLVMAEDEAALQELVAKSGVDVGALNRRLISIGLAKRTLSR